MSRTAPYHDTRILFVDDEPRVLEGYSRSLRRTVKFDSAHSGDEAMALLARGPYAVVVSDMQMPGMSGLELLSRIKEQYPETVRIMLTGDAGQKTAVDAVNEGDIFRFLTKPCPPEAIVKALSAAVKQYRLVVSERELLERTVRGSVEALTNILSLANPRAFGRTRRLSQLAGGVAREMKLKGVWKFETMAMLSQIGYVALSPEVLEKMFEGAALSASEREELASCPDLGAQIVSKIPRLESVAESIRLHPCGFDGKGNAPGAPSGEDIPLGARVLRAVLDYERLEARNHDHLKCMGEMLLRAGAYDPRVLDSLESVVLSETHGEICEVSIEDLGDGMVLLDNVVTTLGVVLVCKDNETTETVRKRLRGFAEKGQLAAKVRVRQRVRDFAHGSVVAA